MSLSLSCVVSLSCCSLVVSLSLASAGNDGYFDPDALSSSSPERIDNMATRVVAALISTGIYDAELEVCVRVCVCVCVCFLS